MTPGFEFICFLLSPDWLAPMEDREEAAPCGAFGRLEVSVEGDETPSKPKLRQGVGA